MPPAGEQRPTWHALPVEDTARRLGVSLAGLASTEAAVRLERYGPNALPEPRRRSVIGIFLGQLKSPLIYLLFAAALAAVALGELADALFIGVVLVLNSAIGGTQEWRAEANTAALRSSIRAVTRVLRDGQSGLPRAPGSCRATWSCWRQATAFQPTSG